MGDIKRGVVDEIYRGIRKNFARRRVKLKSLDDNWQADLTDLQKYSKQNNGFRFLLFVIDTFSRFLFVVPLKSKKGQEVANAFENILIESKRIPKLLEVDRGGEFYSKHMYDVLKKYNIHMYSRHTIKKANYVERSQLTIKRMLFKVFAYRGSHEYIDCLQDVITKYNNKPHRGLGGLKPIQVTKRKEKMLLKTIFFEPKIYKRGKFKLNDVVRIADPYGVFEKSYDANFSTALFYISKVKKTYPPTYKITNKETGEELDRSFYEAELQKTKYDNVYLIEKILQKKGDRVKVKWLGYTQPTWIDKTDLLD